MLGVVRDMDTEGLGLGLSLESRCVRLETWCHDNLVPGISRTDVGAGTQHARFERSGAAISLSHSGKIHGY